MNEKEQSRQFNAFLDHLTSHPGAAPEAPDGMADLAAVAGRLFVLRDALPPPEPVFQQRVWRQVRQTQQPARRAGILDTLAGMRLRWLAPIAAAILLVVLVLPGPRTALGNWMASFRLGSVDVVVAPEPTVRTALTDHHQVFESLAAAQQATGMVLAAPSFLPAGYTFSGAEAISFEELPVWMRPLFVESRYEQAAGDTVGSYLLLRQYNASQTSPSQLGELEYQSADVDDVHQVTLTDGTPAVLLVLGQSKQPLHELIWQRDGVTFELWSNALAADELQRVAESVRS